MKVTRFHHVSVNTNGAPLDDVVGFYRDVSGSATRRGPRSPVSTGTGTRSAIRSCTSSARRRPDRASTRPDTTTASRSTTSTRAIAELEARGIEYVRGVQGEGTVQIWIVDPAGQHDRAPAGNR